MCGMFAALVAIGAFLKINIPLPLYTMHFTLQWFFVLMAGYLLGARLAAISVGVYLLIGLAGVPVFAAGGGPAYLMRPTFGFLLGFLLAAYLIGALHTALSGTQGKTSFKNLLLSGTAGLFLYYLCGMLYFYLMNNLVQMTPVGIVTVIVDYCLITFLPDFFLVVCASFFAGKLMPVFRHMMDRESA